MTAFLVLPGSRSGYTKEDEWPGQKVPLELAPLRESFKPSGIARIAFPHH
jgi:hypothetical protein